MFGQKFDFSNSVINYLNLNFRPKSRECRWDKFTVVDFPEKNHHFWAKILFTNLLHFLCENSNVKQRILGENKCKIQKDFYLVFW